MKTTLSLIALPFLAAAPLSAQGDPQGPGNDLIELFEKMHREGATEDDLRRLLEDRSDKTLIPGGDHHGEVRGGFKVIPMDNLHHGDADQRLRPLIGISGRPLDPQTKAHFGLEKDTGLIVEMVMKDGPAAKQGLRRHDIVVAANGKSIGSLEQLRKIVEAAASLHQPVELEVIHQGQRKKVSVPVQLPAVEKPEAGTTDRPAPERRMAEMHRRLERQQREIEELRHEIEKLKRELRDEE